MNNTIIQQDSFTSDGSTKTIHVRSDVDWIRVFNRTVATNSQSNKKGVEYYWQRDFGDGAKWVYYKSNSSNASNLTDFSTTDGFTLVDSSSGIVGALGASISSITNAAIPIVNATAHGLSKGDVVRLIDVSGAQQLGGYDFTIGYNTNTSGTFSLDYMSQLAGSPGAGSFRKIKFDPLFYPRRRSITKVTQTSEAVVTLSVTHGYKVGQKVRFHVPDAFGMTQLDDLVGTITAVDTTTTTGNTITVDIDASDFDAFAFPANGDEPFSKAEVIPFGQDTAESLDSGVDILSGATNNTGFIGIRLAGGESNPGGENNDVISWVAGKSFSA